MRLGATRWVLLSTRDLLFVLLTVSRKGIAKDIVKCEKFAPRFFLVPVLLSAQKLDVHPLQALLLEQNYRPNAASVVRDLRP